LQAIYDPDTFRELYMIRVAEKLSINIDAIKILVNGDIYEQVFGDNPNKQLCDRVFSNLRRIANMDNGVARLSTFYFGKVQPRSGEENDSWIFYTHRGELTANAGVVMFRHRTFPFIGTEHLIAIVWLLRDQRILQQRLRKKFEPDFTK
jgi:hypothetical protein